MVDVEVRVGVGNRVWVKKCMVKGRVRVRVRIRIRIRVGVEMYGGPASLGSSVPSAHLPIWPSV